MKRLIVGGVLLLGLIGGLVAGPATDESAALKRTIVQLEQKIAALEQRVERLEKRKMVVQVPVQGSELQPLRGQKRRINGIDYYLMPVQNN